jgi:hypothetical protein
MNKYGLFSFILIAAAITIAPSVRAQNKEQNQSQNQSKGQACAHAIDFMALNLPAASDDKRAAIKIALEYAYPGVRLDRDAGVLHLVDGNQIPYRPARAVAAAERLDNATLGDQFVYPYPLDFTLEARKQPYMDPGRVRNEAFFRAVFFDSKSAARKSLTSVKYKGKATRATFTVTKKHCVHVQLKAALDAIARRGDMDLYFRKIGGSFNWRMISGTKRLSSHSFGSAIDVNSQLGKYWKWSGAKPGKATHYDNAIPQVLVEAFERYGFIWGGKWHHYDGMHFEYRPELILYARLGRF